MAFRRVFVFGIPILLLVGMAGILFFRTGLFTGPSDQVAAMKKNQVNKIVMLGDSLTAGTDWNSTLKRDDVVNRGIGGDTVSGFLERLETIIELSPKICFVMGGINDISRGISVEDIFRDYLRLINRLRSSGVETVIQSTLLVESGFFQSTAINRNVSELNTRLRNFCRDQDLDFIDLNRSMTREGGLIPAYSEDGVHLSEKGYEAWGRILIRFLMTSGI